MNKQIYLGNTPLIDLTGYATESYVDTAVSNVDVTDQLSNYALKSALDASIDAVDASIKSSDASIASIKTILGQITGDGAEVTAAIDTFNELKQFVADYTTANDLSTLIASVKTQAVEDASADAAGKYQPIGSYLVADDISTFVDAGDVAAAINSSIAALDLANTYQAKGNYVTTSSLQTELESYTPTTNLETLYLKKADASAAFASKDDISTFVDATAVGTQISTAIDNLDLGNTYQAKGDYLVANDISTFVTGNDVSNHVDGNGVLHIVKCTSTAYAALETKAADTLYIVTE